MIYAVTNHVIVSLNDCQMVKGAHVCETPLGTLFRALNNVRKWMFPFGVSIEVHALVTGH